VSGKLRHVSHYLVTHNCRVRLELALTISDAEKNPSKSQAMAISEKRSRLLKRLDRFGRQAIQYLGIDGVELVSGTLRDPGPFDISAGMATEETDGTDFARRGAAAAAGPESVSLPLPSNLSSEQRTMLGLDDLAAKELEIRQGHANDALHAVRLLLGKKSFAFRERLRPAVGKVQKTRAWAAIQAMNTEISHAARVYTVNRDAMIQLGLSQQDLTRSYKVLVRSDLVTSTAILQPNLPGQSQHKLSWIWTQDLSPDMQDNHLSECESILHRFFEFLP
jgi:hypothetical protein